MIRISPAVISSHFEGRCFSFPPNLNPRHEFRNVIDAIRHAGLKILFPYKDREIPAEKASMLVAIPINKRLVILRDTALLFSS